MAAFNNLLDQMSILDSDLTSTEKLVAIVILSFRNATTGRCNPPIFSENPERKTLCTRTGLSRRSVIATIKKLESKNILTTEKEIGKVTGYQIIPTRAPRAPVQEGNPCTSCTTPVQELHPTRAPRAPITNKEQSKEQSIAPIGAQAEVAPWELPLEPPAPNPADEALKIEAKPAEKLDSHPAEAPAAKAKRQKNPPVPYQKIVDLYNSRCTPTLLRAMPPSDSLKTSIKARYFDMQKMTGVKTEAETLAEFTKFFDSVASSDFLCGRKTGWFASFPWLMQRSKFEAVLNGQYRNHSQQKLPPHKDPAFHFDKAYYDQSIKPDGSTDWGD